MFVQLNDLGGKRRPPIKFLVAETRGFNDRPQLTLIWRPENIICNMASGSLIGLSIFDLVSAT